MDITKKRAYHEHEKIGVMIFMKNISLKFQIPSMHQSNLNKKQNNKKKKTKKKKKRCLLPNSFFFSTGAAKCGLETNPLTSYSNVVVDKTRDPCSTANNNLYRTDTSNTNITSHWFVCREKGYGKI